MPCHRPMIGYSYLVADAGCQRCKKDTREGIELNPGGLLLQLKRYESRVDSQKVNIEKHFDFVITEAYTLQASECSFFQFI